MGSVLDHAEAIRERRVAGATLQSLADEYGVTRERIRQVLMSAYGTTWSEKSGAVRDDDREQRMLTYRKTVLVALAAGERLTRTDVMARAPVWVGTTDDVMGPWNWAVSHAQTTSETPDAEIFASMRRVWKASGAAPGPMPRKTYDKNRVPGVDLSGVRITQRMSWREACDAVGIPQSTATRRLASYTRLSAADATAWVAAFLAQSAGGGAGGGMGTADEYDTWAKSRQAPSMGAVRLATGSWNEVRQQAVVALLTWLDSTDDDALERLAEYGVPTKSGVSQYSDDDIARWKTEYATGEYVSIPAMARAEDIPTSTLRYHLER